MEIEQFVVNAGNLPVRIRKAAPEDAAAVCTVLRRSISELCHLDHQGDEREFSTSGLATRQDGQPPCLAIFPE